MNDIVGTRLYVSIRLVRRAKTAMKVHILCSWQTLRSIAGARDDDKQLNTWDILRQTAAKLLSQMLQKIPNSISSPNLHNIS